MISKRFILKASVLLAFVAALIFGACKTSAHTASNFVNPTNWIAIPAGIGNGTSTFGNSAIGDIAWGGTEGQEKFVAVGESGKMAYSPDGINWTAIPAGTGKGTTTFGNTTDTSSNIYDIAWGGGKFVAVGASGKMAYSSDGENWTAVSITTFDTQDNISGIAWGGTAGKEKFIAAGGEGKMAYSSDGENWTAINISRFDTQDDIYCIVWGGTAGQEKFVAAGGEGKMAYSSDGENWTAIPAGTGKGTTTFGTGQDVHITGLAWGDNKFVAGGWGQMAWSRDGIRWIAIPFGIGNGRSQLTSAINRIAWGGGVFVAVGGEGEMAWSRDGIRWIAIPAGTGNGASTFGTGYYGEICGIAWGNGKFVVGGWGKMAYCVIEN